MPNTPAAVGEAASGNFSESLFVIYYYQMLTDDEHYVLRKIVMSLGTAATEEDGALVAKLFGSVGKMFKADEKMFDAVTGLRYVTVSECLKLFKSRIKHSCTQLNMFNLVTVEVDQRTYS